jgi:hypothetical protein
MSLLLLSGMSFTSASLFCAGQRQLRLFDPCVLPEPRCRIPPTSRAIPGYSVVALGIVRTAIEAFTEIAAAKIPYQMARLLRDSHAAQVRMSQAGAFVRAAPGAAVERGGRDRRRVERRSRRASRRAIDHLACRRQRRPGFDLLYVG